MRNKIIARVLSILMVFAVVVSVIPSDIAFARPRVLTAWLASRPGGMIINAVSGKQVWFMDQFGARSKSTSARGDHYIGDKDLYVVTNYNSTTKLSVPGYWSGEPFKYTRNVEPIEDEFFMEGDLWFSGSTSNATFKGYDPMSCFNGDALNYTTRYQTPDSVDAPSSLSGGTTKYKVGPQATIKWVQVCLRDHQGEREDHVPIVAFEYESVNDLNHPHDSGDGGDGGDGGDSGGGSSGGGGGSRDEPSVANVHLTLTVNGGDVNYKNMSGLKVSATATAKDYSDYSNDDDGELDELSVNVNIGPNKNSNSTSSKSEVSTSVEADFDPNASWVSSLGSAGYQFTGNASADIAITAGDPDTNDVDAKATAAVGLLNDPPDATVSLKSHDYEGKPVKPGYFYVGVPIDLEVKYTDPEEDLSMSEFALGDSINAANNMYEFVCRIGKDDIHTDSPWNFQIISEEATLEGYKATIVFNNPGNYSWSTQVTDAKSLPAVKKLDQDRGSFVVRTEPAPPTALITSPGYAFENEPFKVTQGSTDPNGVDDIIRYTWDNLVDVTQEVAPEETQEPGWTPIDNVQQSWNGINGGTATFPTGSSHHYFKTGLEIEDATGLTDKVDKTIKIISNVPVANIEVKNNGGSSTIKENRKIVLSAEGSLAPSSDGILWNESTWTIKSLSGKDEYINEDETQRNGNKQRVYQFDKPGEYEVTLNLVNKFSKENPDHEDIAACTYKMIIKVIEDKAPVSEVKATSEKPNFTDNPVESEVKFRVNSSSIDGDKIIAPNAYTWKLYEDLNNDKKFTEDELIPESRLTFNAEKTEVALKVQFESGRHNVIKAVVETTETFAEDYIAKLLPEDGSWKRTVIAEAVETVNWTPVIEVIPDEGPSTIPPDEYNPNPGTPYEDVDVDGDKIIDGKFIRAYTNDFFSVTTKITDEIPETAKVVWSLRKKDHSGNYNESDGSGKTWINNSAVSNKLGHDGGSLRIDSSGIYILNAKVIDDCGATGEFNLLVRIYSLPQAVLESNPKYNIGGEWTTKENIRFDLRSTPTIVDDEWGLAWHRMDWSKDNWDVTPLEGQDVSEIHFMDEFYKDRYNDAIPDDDMFSGRNSPIGFGYQTVTSVDIIAIPGLFGQYPTKDESNPEDTTNTDVLTPEYREKFYEEAEKLAEKVQETNPYYNIRLIKAKGWEERFTEIFRQEIMGYFDGFVGHEDDPNNKYIKEYSVSGFSDGVTILTADLAKMTQDGCLNGWINILGASNVDVPESANNLPFVGDVKVYLYDQLIASGTCEEDFDKVITMTREKGNDTWKIETSSGEVFEMTDELTLTVEFSGGPENTAMMPQGWAGILHDESHDITYERSIIDAYDEISTQLRPGSYKFIIYANNNTGTQIYKGNIEENTEYNQLVNFLRAREIYFFNYGLEDQLPYFEDLKTRLTYNDVDHTLHTTIATNLKTFLLNDVLNKITDSLPDNINMQYRSCSFTEPGTYNFRYWGTNYGGKETVPVDYKITVIEDEPPQIYGEINSPYYRDPNDNNLATIPLLGPAVGEAGTKKYLTIQSPDEDYIDFTNITVTYDSNNNRIFTDTTDRKWLLQEGGTEVDGLQYKLERIYSFGG